MNKTPFSKEKALKSATVSNHTYYKELILILNFLAISSTER